MYKVVQYLYNTFTKSHTYTTFGSFQSAAKHTVYDALN